MIWMFPLDEMLCWMWRKRRTQIGEAEELYDHLRRISRILDEGIATDARIDTYDMDVSAGRSALLDVAQAPDTDWRGGGVAGIPERMLDVEWPGN